MQSPRAILSAGMLLALASFILTGCETGRVNKLHSPLDHTSDVTTVPHQNPQYATVATGIPPVPGSPTGAGPGAMQPSNDSGTIRKSPGSEKGKPTPPRQQVPDRFIRQ